MTEKQDEIPVSSGDSSTGVETNNDEHATADSAEASKTGISQRRLLIIVVGLCLSVFLTALDQVFSLAVEVISP
jgi:hypothetical protein